MKFAQMVAICRLQGKRLEKALLWLYARKIGNSDFEIFKITSCKNDGCRILMICLKGIRMDHLYRQTGIFSNHGSEYTGFTGHLTFLGRAPDGSQKNDDR
jgi:hypothetical protein